MLESYDVSARLFVRGLTNLKGQLLKAEAHAAGGGRDAAALLDARLADSGRAPGSSGAPTDPRAARDVHGYTLAAQVHWATEAARLAIAHLLGARAVPETEVETSFAALHRRLDSTIGYVRYATPGDLEAGLDRKIVLERPGSSVRATGRQFLVAYAIPHFYYHVAAAYDILRGQGVALTMGDFLGNWGTD